MSEKQRNIRGAKVVGQGKEPTIPGNSLRGIPVLRQNEVFCPVCDQPAIELPPDDKPGTRYRHNGRMFVCRYVSEGVVE